VEYKVTAITYLEMLQLYLLPPVGTSWARCGDPARWGTPPLPSQIGHILSKNFLTCNMHFSGCWVGREDQIPWALCSPNIMQLIYSCGDTLRTLFTRHCDLR
jgi:hypothetical protein